jgi:hypothetical protein
MCRSSIGLLTSIALGLGAMVSATAAQQREFTEAQRANQVALRQYSWTSRTELKIGGESKHVRLEQVRFDFDGRLQKTAIGVPTSSEPARTGPPGPAGALKKRVVAKKKEEFGDMLAALAALAESYAHVQPDRLKAFTARAVVAKGVEPGSVRIQGGDLVAPADQVTVWIDSVSLGMRRVEITTFYNGAPVTIVADYRTLGNGLTYQARSVLRYPKERVEVLVEAFDYALTR